MKKLLTTLLLGPLLAYASEVTPASLLAEQHASADLAREFATPPDAAHPGVYWYFLDGNQDRDAMIEELHAMRAAGISLVTFLEVDLNIARGPVAFMSEQWIDNLAHVFVEAGKLGMEVVLGTGPGWAGSGGSWVDVSDSMQHLVGSSVEVTGPVTLEQVLPVPAPHSPNRFAGMNQAHRNLRDEWFQDVAVIAFPTPPEGHATIDQVDAKTLKDLQPFTIRGGRGDVPRFVRMPPTFPEPPATKIIDQTKMVDLTSRMQPDGSITWEVPEGNWTIMRFVTRSTGQTTRPAPRTGHGFENNKFDAASFQRHWDNYQKVLLNRMVEIGGPLQEGKGLTTIHLDSWEMSTQNWTETFRQEFKSRRGYDPLPFYPAWMGQVVDSLEKTERFLWDMRKTSQELVLENYVGTIRDIAHEHGFLYSNQPYDMNPVGNIDLGSVADIPGFEFWVAGPDSQYSAHEAASIANTMGREIVRTEAFTAIGEPVFRSFPPNMKNQTDWAFAIGSNHIIFHTYVHQPWLTDVQPGMTHGPHGIHWGVNSPYWGMVDAYNLYLARCSYLLRQGVAVNDILYLAPEAAPYIFSPPDDAMEGASRVRDKRGYSFDAVTPRILAKRAKVEGDRIAFPRGSAYRVMVMPNFQTMTPETLALIDRLVQEGATVIGNPPVASPSLVNYPESDKQVQALAAQMWGGTEVPSEVTRIERGRGAIYWGGNLQSEEDYPSYAAVAALLESFEMNEDFSSPSGQLRFKHRRTDDRSIYFVSNRTDEPVTTEGIFRVDGSRPELWDPLTGEKRALPEFTHVGGVTRVPLVFEPHQSYFVVFPLEPAAALQPKDASENFEALAPLTVLEGAWEVAFDPAWGGPESVTFDSLIDWTTHADEGIRYYSGVATYRQSFDVPRLPENKDVKIYLDLGTLHGMSRIRLNGEDLGVVWTAPKRIEITDAVRRTGNQLEIEVANSWANRLIGDMQPHNHDVRSLTFEDGFLGGREHNAGRYTFATHEFFEAKSPLCPAGLLGPVTIQVTGE